MRWQDALPALRGEKDFRRHLEAWREAEAAHRAQAGPDEAPLPAWIPDAERVERSHAGRLARRLGLQGFAELHRWSVEDRARFWQTVLADHGIHPEGPVLQGPPEDPVWFEGCRWNAAAKALEGPDDRLAVRIGGEGRGTQDVTLGRLRALADQVSHGLAAQGLRPGEAVALYMPMDLECVAAYLGIVQAGMAVVSVPDSFAPAEVETRLRLGDAKAVVTRASFRRGGKIVEMLPKARAACKGRMLVVCGEAALQEGEVAWEDLLADKGPFHPYMATPQHVSNILFSSGTTGEPKAIPWTHLTPWKAAMDGRFHQDIHPGDVVAWPTNIGWMMGPWLIYASLLNGAAIALWEGAPNTRAFLDFCNEAGVTMLGVVPSLARAWRDQGVEPGHLETVQTFSSTGEASNVQDALYLMSLASYRAPVIEYCGGTEIGGGHITGSVLQPQVPAAFSTPALGIEFVVLGDKGPVLPGQDGEIFLVPPSIGLSQRLLNRDHFEEYHKGCPIDGHGRVLRRHGDEVQVLPGGYWRAQGRADDTMNLGGIKVASVELERVADLHPAIRESAAIGVAPPEGGAERLVLFAVTTGEAAPDRLRDEVQGLVRERLNPLFRVHEVVVVDALPRTASNKVMRRTLRKRYAAPQAA